MFVTTLRDPDFQTSSDLSPAVGMCVRCRPGFFTALIVKTDLRRRNRRPGLK